LYDPNQNNLPKYDGDDTITKITILDEDFPGTLCFNQTSVVVNKKQQSVQVKILREGGSDGKVSCLVKTEQLNEGQNCAKEYEDYMPHYEKVNFDHGEGERTINIDIINERHPQIQSKTIGSAKIENEDDDDAGEKPNLMFKVKIEKAEPSIVKVSKKNICYVTID
jgi:hypothetical protein